jgi:hypothetical protein
MVIEDWVEHLALAVRCGTYLNGQSKYRELNSPGAKRSVSDKMP